MFRQQQDDSNPDQFPQDLDINQFDNYDMVDGAAIAPLPNGGSFIDFNPTFGKQYEGTHKENLAEVLDDYVLQKISRELIQAIGDDLDSRNEWETLLTDGIEQLGFRTETKDFPFENASDAFSGAFRQAFLSLVTKAAAECLPPQGPVKIGLEGTATAEIEDKGDRVEDFMNYFLTRIAKEYYPDSKQAIAWWCLQGSVFKKTYFDPTLRRPTSLYIKPQNFVVNYGASTLENATRTTEIIDLTTKDLRIRQVTGMYKDFTIQPNDTFMMDADDIDAKVNNIIGLDNPDYDQGGDKLYRLYECNTNLVIEGIDENVAPHLKGVPLPYIVTIDAQSEKILSIYRNWKEGDIYAQKIDHYTHFIFIPGLGFYGYGLSHIAGGDAKAATIILRQLIDAGTLSNFPGGVRVAGMRLRDNNIRVGPLEFPEIETGHLRIQDAIMPFPFKGPDPILLQLMQQREESVLQSVAAFSQNSNDFNPNAPVGTTLMLLEQSHQIQSSVISNLHEAFKNEFKLLFNLFAECLPDTPYPFNVPGGQSAIMRSDFVDQINIVPVSDPNLSSNTHRLIIWEAILKNADAHPDLHNMREVVKKYYEALKVPDIDTILVPPPPEIKPLDPITEVQHALTGQAIKAGIEQDHAAHIAIKTAALNDPSIQQANPNAPSILQSNIQEHIAFQYLLQMQQAIGFQMPEDPSQLPPEMQNQIASAVAQVVQQQQQQQQEQAPPDPAVLSAQAMMEDVKMKGKSIEAREREAEMQNQIDMLKLQKEYEYKDAQLQLQQNEMEHKQMIDQMRAEVERFKAEMQAEVQMMKSHTTSLAPMPMG